ncbi:MFS transporter [Cellulomonas citrea]|uniref:MFS transporter n=1 Tax=Cellulomonas citrea TaxID=1909423 RepID=UPI00135A6C9C|nr:MFS transporter [Cellulomonas citrea]
MTAPSSVAPDAVRRGSVAVFAVFFLNGFNFASWASRLPAVRDGLHLQPDQMGLVLLAASVGSLVSLPLSGIVVQRLGPRRTVTVFAAANATGLTVAALGVQARSVPLVVLALVLFGVGTGVWDAAMNFEGAAVEQRLGRTVMPRYHAGFSFGTVVAAALAAGAAGLGVPVVVNVPVAVGLSFLGVLLAVRSFLPSSVPAAPVVAAPADEDVLVDPAVVTPAPRRSAFAAWTEPRTLLIGLVVLAAALAEGAANDWVSLAVVDGFDVSHALGAFSFGVFVTAMTTTRLLGTYALDRYGRVAVLRASALFGLVGLAVFGTVGPLWLALLGVVLWGAGAALGFPVGMSAASDDPAHAAPRLAVVSTIGYSAFLAGPPLLGLLAQHVGYRHALLAIIVPVLAGLLVVGAAAPLPAAPARAAADDGDDGSDGDPA